MWEKETEGVREIKIKRDTGMRERVVKYGRENDRKRDRSGRVTERKDK